MDPDAIPVIPLPVLQHLILMDPNGSYGISYDVYTNATEDKPPEGWDAPRSATYRELDRILTVAGFRRLQGSDWVSDIADATETYWTMLGLVRVRPPGKLESTLKGLKAHHIPDWVFDITQDFRLGGEYSPFLRGPTPADLVPQFVNSVPPENLPELPRFTHDSAEALNPNNWRVAP